MEFLNLTAHEITVAGKTIPSSGMVARVQDKEVKSFNCGGIPCSVLEENAGGVRLPDHKEGVILLVSRAVAHVVKRKDVYFPSEFVRDRQGSVMEAKKLARFA